MRRLVIALTLVGTLLGLGASAVKAVSSQPKKPSWSHVVTPGDTLWGLAREVAPGQDPRQTVDRLIRANHLQGGAIVPGQKLVLPRG